MKAKWTTVVIYEDAATRDTAIGFCDQLVERFWGDCEFDLEWCSVGELEPGPRAGEVADKAVDADLIVFAIQPEEVVPAELKVWVESWVERRGDREGKIIGLLDPSGVRGGTVNRYVYLREAAHRSGMDYLTQISESLASATPESPDAYTERAVQVTHVLDDILQQPVPPRGGSNVMDRAE